MNIRTEIKARWSDEEIRILATKEAQLQFRLGVKFYNKALAEIFKDRTLEAIKKVKHKEIYRQIVAEKLALLTTPPRHVHPVAPPSPESSPNQSFILKDPSGQFIDYILECIPVGLDLPPVLTKLLQLATRAEEMGKPNTLDAISIIISDIIVGSDQPRNLFLPEKLTETSSALHQIHFGGAR